MNKITFPLKPRMKGAVISDLHQTLEILRLEIADNEKTEQLFGDSTAEAVRKLQTDHQLEATGVVDATTADLLNRLIAEQATPFSIAGTVVSPFRPGVDKLRVELVDKNVGGDRHIKDAITDAAGEFKIVLELDDLKKLRKRRPDLQVRVFAGKKLLGVSEVCYNASTPVNLNVTLTKEASATLPSEHETLSGELSAYYKGNLRDLKENEEQNDITYLANKTGWDARAVALAALADRFSHGSGKEKIPSVAFYALFRAGLPAEEETLYHTDTATLKVVWEKASQQGVIPQDVVKQIPAWIKQFGMLSKEKLLTNPALVGVSSLKNMLVASRLNEDQQDKFAELYAAHRSNMPAFWKAVTDTLGGEVADRLKVDGKLGFLTINNAPLMQKLHEVAQVETHGESIKDPVQLAQWGYHRAGKWKEMLDEDKRISVPDEIPGDSPEEKRKNYSDYLAAQVRLSYPTASVAEMIKTDKLLGKASDQVHAFLSRHQGEFQIGAQPIEQFIKRNKINDAPDAVITQIKRLQRVYQITPSDQAMTGLLKHGVDAAYHIVRKQKQEFIRAYGKDMGGDDQAALTYDKAVQVHNAVLNIAVSFLTASNAPGIGVHSPGQIINPPPTPPANANDVIAYSTLENLFGEMDYCACDHCRSILSPAAYLVDLLQFIDTSSPEAYKENPQTVLLQRRPDIQYLPLTCENTNTTLPYIDVVSETLEYYVANQVENNKLSLDGYKGHDTSGISSEDLLACPQYVNTTAYTALRDARFPAQLPFHQSLEYLRRYFDKFEVPLPLALEYLRVSNDLERPNPADPNKPVEYGWRDILLEEIGMSRIDNDILTTANAGPNVLWQIYGYPIGTQDQDIINGKAGANIVALSNAKHFTRRLEITYEDLVAILRTRFVNPNSSLIPKLERLGVSFDDIKKLKDTNTQAGDIAFLALLPTGAAAPNPEKYNNNITGWVKDNYSHIMSLITLMEPTTYWAANKIYNVGDLVRPSSTNTTSSLFYYECTTEGTSGGVEPNNWPTTLGNNVNDGTVVWTCRQGSSECNFGILEFRHTDPASNPRLSVVEFVRLLRFIRLWKKTGWTIEQTDAAICALYNDDMSPLEEEDVDELTKLNSGFLRLLPRLGVVMRVMKALGLTQKRDLLPLLACFAPIDTHDGMEWLLDKDGSRRPRIIPSLYRQMFLNPVILNQDDIFSDNYGSYLDGSEVIAKHTEPLRSAFKLTGDEIELIIADLPVDPNLIDRDQNNNLLLTLRNISAVFRRGWLARKLKLSVRELLLLTRLTGLAPFTLATLTDPALMRFITLVQAMRDWKLKTESALYLVWNQDLSGKSAPSMESVGAFARSLRLGLSAVESEFSIKDDPDGAIAQARMALVYGSDAAAFFFGLLNDTFSVQVEFSDPDGTLASAAVRHAIENASGTTDAGAPRLAYDSFRKKLSYSSVLSPQKQTAMKQGAGVGAAAFRAAIDELYAKSQEATSSFFARYPELQSPYNIYVGSIDPAATKRGNLLATILPVLVTQRKAQQTLQAVSAVAQTDLDIVKVLLDTSPSGIALHAAGQVNQPALNDLLALQTEGLTVKFFASDTASDAVLPADDVAANLDYAPSVNGIGNSLPTNPTPNAAISGIWKGFVEAPASGFYKIRIEADLGAKVTLSLNGTGINLTQSATLYENTNLLELRAGTLYLIELKIEKVRNIVRVQWEWEPKGQGRTVIPSCYLYPATQFEAFRDAYIRFLKAASLAEELEFTANEIAYFATNADYVINADKWLNALPVTGNAADPVVLLKPLQALLDYARIKADYAPDDERLLEALKDPVTATADANSLLFTLTRWDAASLDALLVHFGKIIGGNANRAALKDLNTFMRIHDAILLTRKMGISGDTLIEATTNEPNDDSIRALQAALCARYDSAGWRDLVRPINDTMRGLQRDALVAYVLHQMRSFPASQHIDTPEKLFEYFLMDVQMEPCMLTSRIRHALSSVQLFIERCSMNLEPRVSPAAIDSKQWEWRKRYRVWEANRKVFLYPENWLEPELRDDKSPFFKEIESELLQSDITEDSAATALLNYLSKLEEVAKLEPCGIYNDETNDVDHVIARTAGANRKHYYRRREGRNWTPWEQIKLDIEDNPVIPVVWHGRLLLFWLRILKQQPDTGTQPSGSQVLSSGMTVSSVISSDATKVSIRAVLCWSEYYNGKWQPTKTSDVNQPGKLGEYPVAGDYVFNRSNLWAWIDRNDSNALRIYTAGNTGCMYLLNNTHSLPVQKEFRIVDFLNVIQGWPWRIVYAGYNKLAISYGHKWILAEEPLPDITREVFTVVDSSGRTVQHPYALLNAWKAPFFYEDSRHVFYVKTATEPKWIDDHKKYGISIDSTNSRWSETPQLVSKTIRVKELRSITWSEGGPIDPRPGFVDPVPMRQFVSEDAFIHRGIGVAGNVKYGDRQIGPLGVVPNIHPKR